MCLSISGVEECTKSCNKQSYEEAQNHIEEHFKEEKYMSRHVD